MLTKNRYYVIKYQKGLIMYIDPVKIDISIIQLEMLDDKAYMEEVVRLFEMTDFEVDILRKLKSLESEHDGGGTIWSKGLMLMNADHKNTINELKIRSFHETIEIDTSCWDSKYFKICDDSGKDIKSLTLKELYALFG